MELVFSNHAVDQMLKRNITSKEVEAINAHPDGEVAQSRDKKVLYKRFTKRQDNLLAIVIVQIKANLLEVITVMHFFEVRK